MNQLLTLGARLALPDGGQCLIEAFLGGGGQGEVYRVALDGQPLALKWYFPEQASPAQRQAITALVRRGPPSADFLWPLLVLEAPDWPGFGYLMPLREGRFKGLVDLMKGRVDPGFRTLAQAGQHLATAFLALHAQGLCYRDIAFGNVFFDPATGEIQVCDNDNVGVDGQGTATVLGTPRFIAPEVVRGAALPNTQTDLFSLAVLLFYLLHIHHPLEGAREAAIRCFDLPAMNRLYGASPLFIFDPHDPANRPVPGLHDNALTYWPLYPEFLREAFLRAFTLGLWDPYARVRESEWRTLLARLADAICYCARCGAENIAHAATAAPTPARCWSCQQALVRPFQLCLDRRVVLLNHDTRLYPQHLDPAGRHDVNTPLAAVRQHPRNPAIWGLHNLSGHDWTLIQADGQTLAVPPGHSLTLAAGVRVDFGTQTGVIRL